MLFVFMLTDKEQEFFDHFERYIADMAKAVQRIHKAWLGAERADDRLNAVRKEWNKRLGEDKAAVKGVVEADTKGAYVTAKNHLDHIKTTWAAMEETEAGRAMHLHDALEEQRKRRRGLKKAMASANQMELDV